MNAQGLRDAQKAMLDMVLREDLEQEAYRSIHAHRIAAASPDFSVCKDPILLRRVISAVNNVYMPIFEMLAERIRQGSSVAAACVRALSLENHYATRVELASIPTPDDSAPAGDIHVLKVVRDFAEKVSMCIPYHPRDK